MSVKKGEEMDSASCTMHGDFVFPGIDTIKAERWYAICANITTFNQLIFILLEPSGTGPNFPVPGYPESGHFPVLDSRTVPSLAKTQ